MLGSLRDSSNGIKPYRGEFTKSSEIKSGNVAATSSLAVYTKGPIDGDDLDDDNEVYIFKNTSCKIKIDTFVRLFKIITSYPFVIISATLKLKSPFLNNILKSIAVIRFMNFLVYIVPILFVQLILSKTKSLAAQRIAMACYLALYLFPVGSAVIHKLRASSSSSEVIEEGTFCFKPSSGIRLNIGNLSMLSGDL